MGNGYKRAFLQCLFLFVIGLALQFLLGDVPGRLLSYPWSLVVAINYAYILVLIYVFSDKFGFLKSLFDGYSSIASLASVMLMCVLFGLVPQNPNMQGFFSVIGFTRMSASYPFNLLLIYFATTLGLKTIDDVRHIKQRRLFVVLSHASVFVVIVASMLSSADKQRLKVVVPIGHTVHMGWTEDDEHVELPFAIKLNDFDVSYYAPKVAVYDAVHHQQSNETIQLEDERRGNIKGHNIRVVEYVSSAVFDESGDYVVSDAEGAAPAAKILAQTADGEFVEGWISSGSHTVQPQYLSLSQSEVLLMIPPMPKRYMSQIEVVERGGETTSHRVEVNKPVKVGPWYIYQSGYDTERGKWSKISVFECVKDSWYPVIHYALWIILLSGLMAFFSFGTRRVNKD